MFDEANGGNCSFCQVDEMLIFQVERNDGLVAEKNTVTASMKVSSV